MRYTGESKKLISFPLGGIGTGSLGLAGNGRIVDVEIKNQPNKGSEGGFTHFAIKVEDESKVLDARVLNTDLPPGYIGELERPTYMGYGLGPDRSSMAGFPHFRKGEFEGEFPIATLDFADEEFPGEVVMTAFNPFIPSNEFDSSLPGAFFEFEVKNTTERELKYTLAFSGRNYYCQGNPVHKYSKQNGMSYIHMADEADRETTKYGDVTIATNGEDVSYQEVWYRGSWFDSVGVYWNDFTKYGKLNNREYKKMDTNMVYAQDFISTLASHITLKAGESKKIKFVMTWSMPYMSNTWQITKLGLSDEEVEKIRAEKWKNYYATVFPTSLESATYAMDNFVTLQEATEKFTELLYGTTMPPEAIDAIGGNIAIIKSTTCLRLPDGTFYGFEGTHPHMGSCEGTCTHVWSYAYALAYLFPEMERSARSLEYTASMQETGGMGFRVQLPPGSAPTNHTPAVDGQFGTVLRVYREYMISGDKEWLSSIWNAVKTTIEYAWSEKNPDKWDMDKDGIMEGRQHHTLDMELFSPNAWLSGIYLAGLKAGIELASIMGDETAKLEYTSVYESGVKKLNTELYNGEYFIQDIDLKDRTKLMGYAVGASEFVAKPEDAYWNEEAEEMKYQVGDGCGIDQVLGQWHSDLLGLGEVFEAGKVKSALSSIFKYNYKEAMYNHVNPCRLYALNDESGTVICAYPDHVQKPVISVPYAEETMHGFEYEVASHMIYHGLEEEGLKCVRGVRNRYDGIRRNPWNEIECGSNYARSMASYALLLVYSGFTCNMAEKSMTFQPLHKGVGTYFWSVDAGFGQIRYCEDKAYFEVAYGEICLRELTVGTDKKVVFDEEKVVKAGEQIEIVL